MRFVEFLIIAEMQKKRQTTTISPHLTTTIELFRGVAQLVAREVWDFDAAGSNPVAPTKNRLKSMVSGGFDFV